MATTGREARWGSAAAINQKYITKYKMADNVRRSAILKNKMEKF